MKNAFDAISTTITSGLSRGTVHDSLPDGVTSAAIPNRAVSWDLSTFHKETSTSGPEGNTTTTYTYTKSYTVTIDPTAVDAEQHDGYYPLNGPTYLTVKDSTGQDVQIDFPIPAGKVTLQKYNLTINYKYADVLRLSRLTPSPSRMVAPTALKAPSSPATPLTSLLFPATCPITMLRSMSPTLPTPVL